MREEFLILKLGWYRGLYSSLHIVAEGFFLYFCNMKKKKRRFNMERVKVKRNFQKQRRIFRKGN